MTVVSSFIVMSTSAIAIHFMDVVNSSVEIAIYFCLLQVAQQWSWSFSTGRHIWEACLSPRLNLAYSPLLSPSYSTFSVIDIVVAQVAWFFCWIFWLNSISVTRVPAKRVSIVLPFCAARSYSLATWITSNSSLNFRLSY